MGYPIAQTTLILIGIATQCCGVQVTDEVAVRLVESLRLGGNGEACCNVSQSTAVSHHCLPVSKATSVCCTAQQFGVQATDRSRRGGGGELGGVQEAIGDVGQRCTGIRQASERLSATQICVTTQNAFEHAQSCSFCIVLCQNNSFNSAGSSVDEGQELSASDRCSLCAGQVDVEVVASGEGVVRNRTVQLNNVVACARIDDVCVVNTTQNDSVVAGTGDDVVVAHASDNSVVTVASDDGVVAGASVDVVILIAIDDDYVIARTSGQQELSGSGSISRNSNASQRRNVGSSISSDGRSDVDVQVSLAVQNDCLGSSYFSSNIQGNQVATCASDSAGDHVSSAGLAGRNLKSAYAIPASQVYGGCSVESQKTTDGSSGAVSQRGSRQKCVELSCSYRGIVLHGKFLLLQAIWPVLLIFCVNAEFSHGDL